MDEVDRKILALLQENSRLTIETLSERVMRSTAAVQKRIQNLKKSKVIEKEIAVLDQKKLGLPMSFIASVEMEREKIELLDQFKKDMLATPEVQQCYYVTGTTDFILIVVAEDMMRFEEFSRRVFFGNSNVKRFTTNVVMNRVKTGLSIPVDTDE